MFVYFGYKKNPLGVLGVSPGAPLTHEESEAPRRAGATAAGYRVAPLRVRRPGWPGT